MNWSIEIESTSPVETLHIGRCLGRVLVGGDVVAMIGCLGAGKTHLAKGIAKGLDVADEGQVNSPTFVLVNEYQGRLHVFHVDAYRLGSAAELESLGFEEMCESGGVVLVEWADRVEGAIRPDAVWVELTIVGDTERTLTVRTNSEVQAGRLRRLALDRWRE
jgi:tRNA threonylcarbamoyladenosine biosynthesis protein TsaE